MANLGSKGDHSADMRCALKSLFEACCMLAYVNRSKEIMYGSKNEKTMLAQALRTDGKNL